MPLLEPKLQVRVHGLHVLSLENPNKSKDFQKICSLCELFLSVATRYKKQYSLELRLFDRVDEGRSASREEYRKTLSLGGQILYLPKRSLEKA